MGGEELIPKIRSVAGGLEYSKGQQEKGRRVKAGASSRARGPGEGYRGQGGGNHRVPIGSEEQMHSFWLPKKREGAKLRVPSEAMSA